MYIILLKFGSNKAMAGTYMDEHNAWIDQGVSEGIFQCVGSLDIGGGFILAHGESPDKIEKRIQNDPFVRYNVVTAEWHHIDLKMTAPKLRYLKHAA